MVTKTVRIINGKEAHLYQDVETGMYRIGADLMEEFMKLYEESMKNKENRMTATECEAYNREDMRKE